MKALQNLSRAHIFVARFGLNLLLAFVILNILLYPLSVAHKQDPVTARYGEAMVYAAYPERSSEEVDALLDETWGRSPAYEPFLQFREQPFEGRYVNVDPAGFRRGQGPAPWPPEPEALNIFVFGGSTLFGYGVADAETIPAQLESRLQAGLAAAVPARAVRVYNFGRGAFYSTQERILFEKLLLQGFRPDMAIFVDGLNDFFFDAPMFSDRLERLFENRPLGLFARLCRHLPALAPVLDYLEDRAQAADKGKPPLDPTFDDPEMLDERIARYLGNRRLIEAVALPAGVEPFFVVQPVPTYHYDLSQHPFAGWSFGRNSLSGYGYPRLAEALRERPEEANLLWLAELQREHPEPLYVDQVHYSAKMNGLIAEAIAEVLWPSLTRQAAGSEPG